MSDPVRRPSLFERLRTGLEEGIQFARDEHSLRTTAVPREPPPFGARDVRRLRKRLEMSQVTFAGLLNVSPKAVQSWERGERQPSRAALRLLQVLSVEPGLVCQISGVGSDR